MPRDIPENIQYTQYPAKLLALVMLLICLIPAFLNNFGFDFGSSETITTLDNIHKIHEDSVENTILSALTGTFHHMLLEWSAVIIALVTVLLSFSYFGIAKDATTSITGPIIGMALFFSGVTDGFHTLSSIHLLDGVVQNNNLMPFTWAVSRIFNACILLISVLFALGLSGKKEEGYQKEPPFTILLVCILFATTAYVFNHLAATNLNLPQVLYPDNNIPRPLDLIPLAIFILTAPLFILLHIRQKNCLTLALLLSIIPHIILEFHMAFRSTALYDNDFNIAHFLKIIAYLTPLLGILVLHMETFKSLQSSKDELKIAINELSHVNEELDQFAYAASHDLQEPLRMVSSFTGLLEKEYADKIDDTGKEYIAYATNAANNMQQLIVDLLAFSRLGNEASMHEDADCEHIIRLVIENLTEPINTTKAEITVDPLPIIYCNKVNVMRIFQNIIGNAIKYKRDDVNPKIHISYTEDDEQYLFQVRDNGIGFDKQQSTRIFKAFKRLHTKNKYPGSGIGLTMCKRIVHAHNGEIWAESDIDKGSIFHFTILKADK